MFGSPAQFDHVISLVRVGKEDVWLDTTPEVAPFRLLAPSLRHKQALLIATTEPAYLVETPADLPFMSRRTIDVNGSISRFGKLSLQVRQTLRGDGELPARIAFKRTPEAQWKALLQHSAKTDFDSSEVENIRVGEVEATRDPFRLEYQVTRANYLDWSKKAIAVQLPLPQPSLVQVDENTAAPIELGTPGELVERLTLELPENYAAHIPVAVSLTRDYAEYRSVYRLQEHTLLAERTLVLRRGELPASRAGDFLAFRRTITADVEQNLALETTTPATTSAANLSNKELLEAGQAALASGNYQTAAELLSHLVEMEPRHASAWGSLGNAYFGLQQRAGAVSAYRKQIELNAYDPYAYNNLGLLLWQDSQYEEAVVVFRKQIELNPLDRSAHNNLGNLFMERHRYAEAVPELEKSASLDANDPYVQTRLGEAYLNLNHDERALEAFDRAARLGPNATVWNNIAYGLSSRPAHLARAQQYAESAVAAAGAMVRNLSLETLSSLDLGLVNLLTSCWDTLGWILYQRGEMDRAEDFLGAAWVVSQRGEIGDHLGQLYERRGQKDRAIKFYAQALAAIRPAPETRARLTGLVDSNLLDAMVERARSELVASRTLEFPDLFKAAGTADFFFLLAPSKPHEAKFISGDEKLRAAVKALCSADYNFQFPANAAAKLLRRGRLSCAGTGACTLVLENPENVTSVD